MIRDWLETENLVWMLLSYHINNTMLNNSVFVHMNTAYTYSMCVHALIYFQYFLVETAP